MGWPPGMPSFAVAVGAEHAGGIEPQVADHVAAVPDASLIHDVGRDGACPGRHGGCGRTVKALRHARRQNRLSGSLAVTADRPAPGEIVFLGEANVDFCICLVVIQRIRGTSQVVIRDPDRSKAQLVGQREELQIFEQRQTNRKRTLASGI